MTHELDKDRLVLTTPPSDHCVTHILFCSLASRDEERKNWSEMHRLWILRCNITYSSSHHIYPQESPRTRRKCHTFKEVGTF